MDLSQFGIGNGNDTSNPFTVPGLEGLQSTLATIMTASMVIGGLFIILYIINLVQRIRADRAMIAMQKDVSAIKTILEQFQPAPRHSDTAPVVEPRQEQSL